MTEFIYWEKQGTNRMCALHCINSILQGPLYSEIEMATIGADLDRKEKSLITDPNEISAALMDGGSGNVASDGFFNISVLIECLRRQRLQTCIATHPDENFDVKKAAQNYEGFILHLNQHWFAIRKIHGNWWNLDSLKPCPREMSADGLNMYLEAMMAEGYSIFIVRCTVGCLPSPKPQMMKNMNQFYLKREHIEKMEKEAKEKEAANAKNAEGVADGGGKSFLAQAPKGAEPHEWPETAGHRLDGGASQGITRVLTTEGEEDPELMEALKLSMATFKQELKVKAPEPEPVPGVDACTVRVRLPAKNLMRRFEFKTGVKNVFQWLEYETSNNESLGVSTPLPTLPSYSLVQTFLGRKIQKQASSIYLFDTSSPEPVRVDDCPLSSINFQRQEQFDLQLN